MVHSYLDNAEYGYDQINVGSSSYNNILRTLDANNINKISTIQEREIRLFNKLNAYKHPQPNNIEKKPMTYSDNLDLYSLGTDHRIKLGHYAKKNVEDYHYGTGNAFKDQLQYPQVNKQYTKNYPWSTFTKVTPEHPPQIKKISDGFNNNTDINDIEYLQEEYDKLEQKNNMFIILIFFLAIIVIVQHTKLSNGPPMHVVFVPNSDTNAIGNGLPVNK